MQNTHKVITPENLGKGFDINDSEQKINIAISKEENNNIILKEDGIFASTSTDAESELELVTDYSTVPLGYILNLLDHLNTGSPLNRSGSNKLLLASIGKPEDNVLRNPRLIDQLRGMSDSWYKVISGLSDVINEDGTYKVSPNKFIDYIQTMYHKPTKTYFSVYKPNSLSYIVKSFDVRYTNITETRITKENLNSLNIIPSGDGIPPKIQEISERYPDRLGEIQDDAPPRDAFDSGIVLGVINNILTQGNLEYTFELPAGISKEEFISNFDMESEYWDLAKASDYEDDTPYAGVSAITYGKYLNLRKSTKPRASYREDYKEDTWMEYNGNSPHPRKFVPLVDKETEFDIALGYDKRLQSISERDGKIFVTITYTNYSFLTSSRRQGSDKYFGLVRNKIHSVHRDNEEYISKQGDSYVVKEPFRYRSSKAVKHTTLLSYTSSSRVNGAFTILNIAIPASVSDTGYLYPVTYSFADPSLAR